MARNEEKARSAMNMYLRRHEIGRVQEKRPVHTAFVTSVDECQKWMQQVIRETVSEVSLIQNAGLGEAKIREKNDLINKLIRERKFWERRIISLAGIDLAEKMGIDVRDERRTREKVSSTQLKDDLAILSGDAQGKKRGRGQRYGEGEDDGGGGSSKDIKFKGQISTSTRTLGITGDFDSKDVIGVDGYYYFGAAKDLPGVKELYEKSKVQEVVKVKKRDLKQRADAAYFGFLEDFDKRLLMEEAEMEDIVLQRLLENEGQAPTMALPHVFNLDIFKVENDNDGNVPNQTTQSDADEDEDQTITETMIDVSGQNDSTQESLDDVGTKTAQD